MRARRRPDYTARHGAGASPSSVGWATYAGGGKPRFFIRNNNSLNGVSVGTSADFNDGAWHSVIFTYSGSSSAAGVTIYIDNVSVALTTFADTLNASTQGTFDTEFGRDNPQNAFDFTGDCAGTAVFSGVISSGHRATLHNNRKPPIPADVLGLSGLLHFWRFGNGAAYPTVPDEKASAHGTVIGLTSPTFKTYAPPYA